MYVALVGLIGSYWRYQDGGGDKFRPANLAVAVIVLIASALAYGTLSIDYTRMIGVGIPALTTAWLLIRGMPGWEHYSSNVNGEGMVRGFALPTTLAGLLSYSFLLEWQCLLFAVSGWLVAITYVELSKREPLKYLTAEQWGRISYGLLVMGLAAL